MTGRGPKVGPEGRDREGPNERKEQQKQRAEGRNEERPEEQLIVKFVIIL